jgi:predicted metalloendopeptidase
VHLNGRLTLGENTADNGGLKVAYMALRRPLAGKPRTAVDGFTPEQRFFLGFANVWCQKRDRRGARQRAQTDPHSSGPLPRHRQREQQRRVRPGLRVQGRTADGAGECLPAVVAEAPFGLSS